MATLTQNKDEVFKHFVQLESLSMFLNVFFKHVNLSLIFKYVVLNKNRLI